MFIIVVQKYSGKDGRIERKGKVLPDLEIGPLCVVCARIQLPLLFGFRLKNNDDIILFLSQTKVIQSVCDEINTF